MPRLLALLMCMLSGYASAAEVWVETGQHGESFQIEATAEFDADLRLAWQVLTDYDHLARFIPGLRASRTVERHRNGAVVEQKGEARLLFFAIPIEVKLAVEEFPYFRITSRAVAGNFRDMRNAYYLDISEGRVRLRYSGRMTPDFSVPPLIGTWILRRNVEQQFGAMVDEILRRSRAAAGEPSPPSRTGPRDER